MSTWAHDTTTAAGTRRLALLPLGFSISLLFVISYVLCIALGLVWWNGEMHQPWLQFLPGFTWISWGSFFLGLIESFLYGWYIALIFTPLFNFFSARFG